MKYTFKTKLSVQECKDRLNEEMRYKRNFEMNSNLDRPYKVTTGATNSKNNKFWVRSPRIPFMRDSYSRIFHGEFLANGNSTIIEGKFRLGIAVIIFTIIWELFVLSSLVIHNSGGRTTPIQIPLMMTVIMLLLVFVGARKSKQLTIDFMIKTFKATPAETNE